MADLMVQADAVISKCGKYRYWLERRWGEVSPQVFVMLNPSTADATKDDATIRRCIRFAKREEAGGLIVVNLFGLRATNPAELDQSQDPVGPGNAKALSKALLISRMHERSVICAWGANHNAHSEAIHFIERAKDFDANLVCLGVTKSGAPRHPLYIKCDAPLAPLTPTTGGATPGKTGGAA